MSDDAAGTPTDDIEKKFAVFAEQNGLKLYPDPSGERYVYRLDGRCEGKKLECADFMDELWNALARARGRGDLVLGAGCVEDEEDEEGMNDE